MRRLDEIYEVTENQNNLTLFCLFVDCEPIGFEEAIQDERRREAMDKEIQAIGRKKKDTGVEYSTTRQKDDWSQVDDKTKKNTRREVESYKAILVAKGYSYRAGIDYDVVFAHVALLETIRLIISLEARNERNIFQRDVKLAFLNGYLEEIYVEQTMGYVKKGYAT